MPPPVIGEAENPAADVDPQAAVNELQNQMTAMQAALEGNSQANPFKQRPFNGFPNEDVNEWLSKFERFAKFYNWSNAKKLGAIALLLEGSALAWYHTLGEETTGNLTNLIDALKDRFGAQNLEFIFRQELYARKQGLTEPLSIYTEDIIKKCQRLSLSDKDMMNIFINGLSEDLKTHVVLNQPKTFAEAENLARLRDSVTKSSPGNSLAAAASTNFAQNQRIQELEGQVNLLFSLASKKKASEPVHALNFGHESKTNPFSSSTSEFQADSSSMPNRSSEMQDFKNEIIAAIQTGFRANNRNQNVRGMPRQDQGGRGGARGRNLRTTDGQPICNECNRVGHVARYCWFRQPQQQQQQVDSQGGFFNPFAQQQPQQKGYAGSVQSPSSFSPNQQNLNGMGPSQWGQWGPKSQ